MTDAATDVTKLTASQILHIDADSPEQLFPHGADEITETYHQLAKIWFPDLNKAPEAGDVFKHLTKLRNKAKEKLEKGTWQEAGYFTCKLTNGAKLRVSSDVHRAFDLGTMHIGPANVTYVVDRKYKDLFQNAVRRMREIKFLDNDGKPSKKLKDTYANNLPTLFATYESDDALILTIKKRPEDVLLRDLLPHIKDNLDRHVAWITSRLHEMVRFFDHAGIAHNALTLDNIFVSPKGHAISVFGGWWYAASFGDGLKAIPGEALEFLPDSSCPLIPADGKLDREMIRAVSRELLGDRGGTKLTRLKTAPKPMIDYLRMPSSGNAQTDLNDWYQTAMPKSFGARRFTELNVSYSDVYKPGG